jgi:mannose-6-phosphate isomerase
VPRAVPDPVEPDFAERPWGAWYVLATGEGYKVKRIEVQPHSRLSYQTHHHRSEHWVILSGIAKCTIEGKTVVARPGESVNVEVGLAHRIGNQGDRLWSLRCSAANTSARTTSSASRTTTAARTRQPLPAEAH